ncbi:MAG: thiamine phosphate synthase, partial [Phycisphaerales bacterium]|nr:thiamine phosphate synthase [Phycisphaerales bacterium]
PLIEARRLAGSGLLIGVSTSNMDQALAAAQGGADVCGVGPMFATSTKHKPVLAGPEYLRSYLENEQTARVPHLAIGGITPDSARIVAAAGGRGIAVSSAVCSSPDPRGACERLLAALSEPPA